MSSVDVLYFSTCEHSERRSELVACKNIAATIYRFPTFSAVFFPREVSDGLDDADEDNAFHDETKAFWESFLRCLVFILLSL